MKNFKNFITLQHDVVEGGCCWYPQSETESGICLYGNGICSFEYSYEATNMGSRELFTISHAGKTLYGYEEDTFQGIDFYEFGEVMTCGR
ncbi:hypothetical protein [Fusobacterium necrophorum]|uniref:hypothetical protein n=1 Tax=Fusobacterium necrophorum TaxID=859 RepID=UPI000786852E|nr:hypothetical protein [Fusobacterium necrophorum]KYM39624.1 hypothetical protein A2U03_06850 [Fusobacterium necrophorum subsp. funduliforme]